MECCYPVDCGEYAVSPRLVPAAYCPRKHCEPEPFIPRLPHCHKPKHYCTEKPEKMYCEKPKYYCTEKPEKMYCEKPKYYCFEKPEKMYCEKPKYYCIEKPHKSYCEKPNYYCIEKPHKSYCEKPQYCCIEKPHKSYCEKPQYCCIEKPHKSYSEKPKYYCTEKPVKCYAPQYVCCEPPPPRHKVCPVPDPCCHQQHYCKPVKTKYIMPCYRYEDGRVTNQPTVLMRRACEVACGKRQRKPFVVASYAADPHNEIRRYHSEDERGNCCFHFERKKPESYEPCWDPEACHPCAPCHSSPACYSPVWCLECQYVDGVYSHPTDPLSHCRHPGRSKLFC
ncbi:hypothetical protein PYW07_007270 [Mythimna separata]|uniref:Uncharacterized protein n=1 Tax=Mythimna separata TaxID=271217 RepID=A0AAD7Z1Z8_MYTSE|nr:hypothetical protein PYW07_007270 [Mythimna separata]